MLNKIKTCCDKRGFAVNLEKMTLWSLEEEVDCSAGKIGTGQGEPIDFNKFKSSVVVVLTHFCLFTMAGRKQQQRYGEISLLKIAYLSPPSEQF